MTYVIIIANLSDDKLNRCSFLAISFVLQVIFIGLNSKVLYGQERSFRIQEIEIYAGLQGLSSRDLIVSPLIYSGNQTHIGARVLAGKTDHPILFTSSISSGRIETVTDGYRESFKIQLYIDQQYNLLGDRKIQFWIGPGIEIYHHNEKPYFKIDNLIGPVPQESTGFTMASLGFSAEGTYEWKEKHRFHTRLYTPVISYYLRPPYFLSGSRDGDSGSLYEALDEGFIRFPGRYYRLMTEAAYSVLIGRKSRMSLNLEMSYSTFADPFRSRYLTQSITFGYVRIL